MPKVFYKNLCVTHKKFVMGLTLTEIMVSVVIIVIVAGGLFGAFIGAQHFLNRSRHKMQAYNFAVEALDKLRGNYIYTSSPAMDYGNNHSDTEIDPAGIMQGDLLGLGGTLKYDVTDYNFKVITIKVHWDEPR